MEPFYEQDVLCDLPTSELGEWATSFHANHHGPHANNARHLLSYTSETTTATNRSGSSRSGSNSTPGVRAVGDMTTGVVLSRADAMKTGNHTTIPRVATPIPGIATREAYLDAVREFIDTTPRHDGSYSCHTVNRLSLTRHRHRRRRRDPSLPHSSRRLSTTTRAVLHRITRPFRKTNLS